MALVEGNEDVAAAPASRRFKSLLVTDRAVRVRRTYRRIVVAGKMARLEAWSLVLRYAAATKQFRILEMASKRAATRAAQVVTKIFKLATTDDEYNDLLNRVAADYRKALDEASGTTDEESGVESMATTDVVDGTEAGLGSSEPVDCLDLAGSVAE